MTIPSCKTAVDLSRKSDGVHMRSGSGGPDIVNGSGSGSGPGSLEANSSPGGGDQDDSEDEAPLDLTGAGKNGGSRPVSQMEIPEAEADDEAVISRPQSPPINHTSTNGHEAKTPTPPGLPMLPLPKGKK